MSKPSYHMMFTIPWYTNPTFVIWSWFTAKDDGITGRIMSLYLTENFLVPYKALLTRFFSLSCPRMHSQSSLVFDTASSLVISLSFNRWHFAAWSASSGSLILEHISSNDLETDSVSTTNVQSSSSKLVCSDYLLNDKHYTILLLLSPITDIQLCGYLVRACMLFIYGINITVKRCRTWFGNFRKPH